VSSSLSLTGFYKMFFSRADCVHYLVGGCMRQGCLQYTHISLPRNKCGCLSSSCCVAFGLSCHSGLHAEDSEDGRKADGHGEQRQDFYLKHSSFTSGISANQSKISCSGRNHGNISPLLSYIFGQSNVEWQGGGGLPRFIKVIALSSH